MGFEFLICCNVERTEGRLPKTTIRADGGPVGKTPFCPFYITTQQESSPERLAGCDHPTGRRERLELRASRMGGLTHAGCSQLESFAAASRVNPNPDGGPVRKTPVCPFHITTRAVFVVA